MHKLNILYPCLHCDSNKQIKYFDRKGSNERDWVRDPIWTGKEKHPGLYAVNKVTDKSSLQTMYAAAF